MTHPTETDRELLELAAKAAGYTLTRHTQDEWKFCFGGVEWNPLTDDGDALRLAVKLGLCMDTDYNYGIAVGNHQFSMAELWEPYDRNPYAATRRAIVRAAAEIGRAMQ